MSTKTVSLCSICSLSYNHAAFIPQHMEGIFAQEYKNIEIIALDDGSSDESVQVLKECQAKSPFPFEIIEQKNSGNVGGNFNTLLDHAKGKYVVMISCDDVLPADALFTKIELMKQDDNLVFVVSRDLSVINEKDLIIEKDVGQTFRKQLYEFKTAEELRNFEYEYMGSFWMQNSVFRKDIVDIVGGFDEDLIGDDTVLRSKIFSYMINHKNLTFKIIPTVGLYYRIHSDNISKKTKRQMKIFLEVFKRYYADKPFHPGFKNWLITLINDLSLKEILPFFLINKNMFYLIFDRDIQKAFFKRRKENEKNL